MVLEFDGKLLQLVVKGEVDLSFEEDISEVECEEWQKEFVDLLIWLQEMLSDYVKEVWLFICLIELLVCLIIDVFGMIFVFVCIYWVFGQEVLVGKWIFEFNLSYLLVIGLC